MGKYRKVDPKIWNDAKFRSLSDNGKLVFFFLLTHPHMTPLGAMRASIPGLAWEMGWKEKAFREVLSKAMAKADEKACFVWLPKFLKYNKPESPNVVKAWLKCIDDLPECDMKNEALQKVKAFLKALPETFLEALPKALLKDFAKTSLNQEQEQEQEQDIEEDTVPLCPHKDIVTIYHEILPELPKVKEWTEERQNALRARWREDGKRQTLDWWKGFFEHVGGSRFLMGDNGSKWQPNLEWLVQKKNFINVIEGKYHDE